MERNVRLLGLGVAIRMFGNALYFPFLALFLVNVLHVSYFAIGVIFVGVGLVQLPFGYLGGLLTDRLGRRRLILIGLVAEAVVTAVMAYAFYRQSLLGAIVAAALGGIVGSATSAAPSAYIADLSEGKERTRAFTWYRIGFNAGYSAGVTLGGILVTLIDFAGTVAVAAVLITIGTVFLAATLEESPYDEALRRRAGAPISAVPTAPDPPKRSLGESIRILARDSVALEVLIAVILASVVVGQWAVTFPLFVHNFLGISYSLLGIGLALNGLVVVFGQTAVTESVLGRRHTTIAIAGVALYIVSYLALGASGLFGVLPVVIFLVAVVVLTIGENLVTIPQATLPSNMAPPGEVGSYNGAFQSMGGAGYIVSVFIGGVVLSFVANPLLIWVLLVAPAIPSIILFRHAARRLSRTVDRA